MGQFPADLQHGRTDQLGDATVAVLGGDALKPDLLIDLGGTNIRCGLATDGRVVEDSLESRAHEGAPLAALLGDYRSRHAPRGIRRIALAVAAPPDPDPGGPIRMTNGPYRFRADDIAATLGADSATVVNDFEAIARAIPRLGADDKVALHAGSPVPGAPILVVGPGTGLGTGLLVRNDGAWLAVPTEGGHATLASPAAEYDALLVATRDRFGHASAERLLCGEGLRLLHSWHSVGRLDADDRPAAAEIAAAAGEGDPDACQAVRTFFDLLASFVGSAALIGGSRGGIVLAGGVVPRLRKHLDVQAFRARMTSKGRYRDYLDSIPLWLVVHPCPSMPGLAQIAAG